MNCLHIFIFLHCRFAEILLFDFIYLCNHLFIFMMKCSMFIGMCMFHPDMTYEADREWKANYLHANETSDWLTFAI